MAAKANASTPRYLTATTASSRNRAAVASTSSDKKPDKLRTPGSASTSTRTPVSGTSTSGKSVKSSRSSKAPSSGPVASTSKRPTPAAVTKPRPLQKSTSSSPPTQSISKASTSTAPPIPSKPPVDSLQAAAQSLPWAFMTTNLENGFKSAELAARKELNDHEQKLTAQEAEVSDQRVRFQAEKAIAFYEELATDELSKTLPAVMEMYMDHGATCERITADALRLANGYQGSSIRPYNDTLVEIRT
ncbi:hypothetical protein PLICRDRAFT_33422 [Plicaturopsis crispa FD-325 SS-3]|nr:hypothetical protein PLICRDRAFT_33422 [Plicaturopsis crispa FD-325 SS-3]